jgi:thiol-disulfide isomerase/thioredoxin
MLCLLTVHLVFAQENAAKEKGPSDPKAQKTWAEAVRWLGEGAYSAAIDDFKKANKQDGGHCHACADRIIKYGLEIGDYKSADTAAQQEIDDAKGPSDIALAHLARGTIQFREGVVKDKSEKFADAEKEFKAALAAYPNFPAGVYEDGMALARLKEDDAAKAQFQRYVGMTHDDDPLRERALRYLEDPALARARMAPAFAFTAADGRRISLDGLTGKVVLIDFWATWCGPCREALPHIREIAQKFSGQPLVVVSISLDKDESKWQDFVAKNNMTWLQYRDGSGDIARLFSVNAIPHTFTIDADGVLQDERIGDEGVESKLKKLCARAKQLQETPPAAQKAGN